MAGFAVRGALRRAYAMIESLPQYDTLDEAHDAHAVEEDKA